MTQKDTNPKDAIGQAKWRVSTTIPQTVMWEVGVGMLEGAMKYGRHNYRVAGVHASVYVDAAKGHIDQWWEGENTDADSGLSHITKAICSLVVLRDAMIQDMLTDDRPPKASLDDVRSNLQGVVDRLREKYPEPKEPYTEHRKWLEDGLEIPGEAHAGSDAFIEKHFMHDPPNVIHRLDMRTHTVNWRYIDRSDEWRKGYYPVDKLPVPPEEPTCLYTDQ
jgi:hypothetical protein